MPYRSMGRGESRGGLVVAGARSEQDSEQVMAETVALTVTPDAAAVAAGGEVTLVALVRNAGAEAARYTLDVSGASADWIAVDEPSFILDAGGRRLVPITVRPSVVTPAAARPSTDPLRLVVRVAPDDGAIAPAEASVSLLVGAPDQLGLELASPLVEGREATFHATFVNPTNAPAALALLVTGVGAHAAAPRVRVEPEGTVLVPPHERVTVRARVLPSTREAPTTSYTYNLEFRGQDVGALNNNSPYLTRHARFVYMPEGGGPPVPVSSAVISAPARRAPRRTLLVLPLVLLLLAGLAAAWMERGTFSARGAASLPVIARFTARADARADVTTLTWQVTGAATTTLDGIPVAAAASRSIDVSHTVTAMHLLRATNQAGTVLGVVTTAPPAATPVALRTPSIDTFELRQKGSNAPYRLAWLTYNASWVTLDGIRVPSRGHWWLTAPVHTATHYLVASNAVGQIMARVDVVVVAATTPAPHSYKVAVRP